MTPYQGPERRRRFVYVTRNTEYFTKDGVCVAVRDRDSGHFLRDHKALGTILREGIRYDEEGQIQEALAPADLRQGDSLHFANDPMTLDVLTSPLEAIRRPERAPLAFTMIH